MNETTKSEHYWKASPYLKGTGLDVGAGSDCLPYAIGWDIDPKSANPYHGDAHYLRGIPDNAYDFLYSSHCLEHMHDVPLAIKNWLRVVKPGGYLYIVVPCFIRYEHGMWPSRFNQDHKQTFHNGMIPYDSKWKLPVGDNHWTIAKEGLFSYTGHIPLNVVNVMIQDDNFDYDLFKSQPELDQTLGDALAQIRFIVRK